MKNTYLLILLFFSQAILGGEIDKKTVVITQKPKIWQTFCLSDVRLLPGSPFYNAMKVSQQYLLDMDVERMLNRARKEVGLPEKKATQVRINQKEPDRVIYLIISQEYL